MNTTPNPIKHAFSKSRSAFWTTGLFTGGINVLMLTGPLFMLQVYDRVLASGSVPTLVALFILVAILYAFLGIFVFVRSRILSRTAYRLELELTPLAHKTWIYAGLGHSNKQSNPVLDLRVIRQFISGNGLPALFDLPWIPIYLIFVFILHPWLGWLATAGAIIVALVTYVTEYLTKPALDEAAKWGQQEMAFSHKVNNNSEAIISMGMMGNISTHWSKVYEKALGWAQRASNRAEAASAFVKSLRLALQSALLGLGAYLAIIQEIGPGAMIAATILGGRALAPIDQAIAHWKPFVSTRQAYKRLKMQLAGNENADHITQLPDPQGKLQLAGVVKLPDNRQSAAGRNQPAVLKNINFQLEPGDALGVIGPSASGKTTLARLIAGVNMPDHGTVRIDGATYEQWDRDRIGTFVGYLPQNVELIAATLRENISRFDPNVEDKDIISAAKLAGIHDMILGLPEGYETNLGKNPNAISGGQAQRIALARAIYKTPSLVILDEPNSNLDPDGEAALARTILHLRENKSCVIIMAHRPSAIAAVNKVLVLSSGKQVEFGPKDEIMRKVTRAVPKSKVKPTYATGTGINWQSAAKR